MSTESVKKYVNIEHVGFSPSGKTKVWAVTGKNGSEDGIGYVKWSGAWRKYVYYSDEAFYDWDCLRLIADFCEQMTKLHVNFNYKKVCQRFPDLIRMSDAQLVKLRSEVSYAQVNEDSDTFKAIQTICEERAKEQK